MPSTIYEYEQPYLAAALAIGKEFLLSPDLFWNLGISAPKQSPAYPQISLGNILLSIERLKALEKSSHLNDSEMEQLKALAEQLADLQNEWKTAWQDKAGQEFDQRNRHFARFLSDLQELAQGMGEGYVTGIRNRAILEILALHLAEAAKDSKMADLAVQDQVLRSLTQKSNFIWPPELSGHFAEEKYWFLHSTPKA